MLDTVDSGCPECRSVLIAHKLSQLKIDTAALSGVQLHEEGSLKNMVPATHFTGHIYTPTLQADPLEKDKFYTDLLCLTQKVPADDKIIVLGDFNTRVEADELSGLEISLKKTDVLYQSAPQEIFQHPPITIGESELKSVQQFTYLGSIISSGGITSIEAMLMWLPQERSPKEEIQGLPEKNSSDMAILTAISGPLWLPVSIHGDTPFTMLLLPLRTPAESVLRRKDSEKEPFLTNIA
ncbi:hypothetical protein WISP_59840 [Willisornis vidua]|uniref:Endonuclease/exonuclease/phosphatase domain-containing protein n=1 Tax=Willisornis vidua TaxID=1566151 RepID=A0ABQ9DAR8_9PASS|nr:hypothetical protein WISP_59840 [Willisornis vidua]